MFYFCCVKNHTTLKRNQLGVYRAWLTREKYINVWRLLQTLEVSDILDDLREIWRGIDSVMEVMALGLRYNHVCRVYISIWFRCFTSVMLGTCASRARAWPIICPGRSLSISSMARRLHEREEMRPVSEFTGWSTNRGRLNSVWCTIKRVGFWRPIRRSDSFGPRSANSVIYANQLIGQLLRYQPWNWPSEMGLTSPTPVQKIPRDY